MKILVSGATRTFDRLWPRNKDFLGRLVQPHSQNDLAKVLKPGMMWGVDNAAFSNWDREKYLSLVEKVRPLGPDWIVLPDMVANARGTVYLADGWYGLLEDGEGLTPWALVGQDGMEDLDWDYWFGYASCFFVGGSTRWKLSRAARDLAREAKRRGKLVHMGRVNSLRRLTYAFEIGCDSVDGTGYSMYPATNLPPAIRHLRALHGQSPLDRTFNPTE